MNLRERRAEVVRLVEESAALRARLVDLVRLFRGRRRSSKVTKIGAAALAVLGLGGAALGARTALHSRKVKRALMSPVRRRLRMALAAGVASLIARRLARRALAP